MTFKDSGFEVVKEFISQADAQRLYEHTLDIANEGMLFDEQMLDTPSFYNDKEIRKLHYDMINKMESITGLRLYQTYCYNRIYKQNDILRAHKDRPACEISATVSLGMDFFNWHIYIMSPSEHPCQVTLYPGDALLYRGCDLLHWRPRNVHAKDFSQAFLHYVDKDGPCAWAKDDAKR